MDWSRYWEWWLRLARHPVFFTIANALGASAGFLAALYTKEILSASVFDYHGSIVWPAVLFWVCFLVFVFTFLSREWAVQNLARESEIRLQEMIRTMPPRGFIVEFAQYSDRCFEAVEVLTRTSEAKEAELSAVIRLILRNIATLAQKFDARSADVYAANVMLAWETADTYRAVSQHPPLDIKFIEPETNTAVLRVLVLEAELSASTASKEPTDPDPAMSGLRGFALPVPADTATRSTDKKRWRVLPGAPLACVRQDPNAYDDTTRLGDWFSSQGEFSESIQQEVLAYFQSSSSQRVLRSFASLPLTAVTGERLGVLNLHSSGPDILGAAGAPSQFYPLIRPLTALLAKLAAQVLKTKT